MKSKLFKDQLHIGFGAIAVSVSTGDVSPAEKGGLLYLLLLEPQEEGCEGQGNVREQPGRRLHASSAQALLVRRQCPPTCPLARPSKPSCTTSTRLPWMRPILTVERTAAFMPAAGAPTFITATV